MASAPLKRGDIPLSAIDFHISSIVEELMQNSAIANVVQAVAAKKSQHDPHDCLRRAMWLFWSSINSKMQLHTEGKIMNDGESQALQPIWQAAHAAADAWAADYIRRRFS